MTTSARTRARAIDVIERVTGLGLKAGVPLAVITAGYLIYTALSSNILSVSHMQPAAKREFADNVHMLITAFVASGAVVVGSIVIRLFFVEAVGQILAVVGAVLYFGSPAFFGLTISGDKVAGNELFASIVQSFRTAGLVALLPGLVLVFRDAILRIWNGMSVRRVMERRWGDEEERRKRQSKPKVYGSCWDMPFCRDFVRRVCPAYKARKPCWRIKVGCYCDEKTILTAMTSYGADNDHVRGIMHSLGLDQERKSLMNARQKRARCRRCGIYAEHQRQKYRLVSPMVFPVVGLLFYVFYGQISRWLYVALEQTDRFMRIITLASNEAGYAFSDQGHLLTALAMVWLGMIVVSYMLRAVEYLIFEVQV